MPLYVAQDTEFDIYHGDTLTNDRDNLRDPNPSKKPAFDAIVPNPPLMNAPPGSPFGQSVLLRSASLPLGYH